MRCCAGHRFGYSSRNLFNCAKVVQSVPDPACGLSIGDQAIRNRAFLAPMAGITDSMNMAQKGLYKELQYVAPGGSWNESIWITPIGY